MPSLLGTGPRTRRDHHGPTAALTTLACHCHGRPPSTRRLLPSVGTPPQRILSCIVFLSPSTSPCSLFFASRAHTARLNHSRPSCDASQPIEQSAYGALDGARIVAAQAVQKT